MRVHEIFRGVPARSDRGYLGWSACFLLVTDAGRKVLFDTAGYNERAALATRLAACGAPPEAIDLVILSHFHFDHAANWDVFTNADILVHEAEREYLEGAESLRDPALLRYHGDALAHARNVRWLSGEHDLGDHLTVLEAPGHTPGSVALRAQEHVFCGDALKHRHELGTGTLAGPVWNEATALATLKVLRGAGRFLHPGHDAVLEKTGHGWVPGAESAIAIELFAPARIEVQDCPGIRAAAAARHDRD